MAAQSHFIFNANASPRTGIGDGEGAWLRVSRDPKGSGQRVDVTKELIHFQITGAVIPTIKILTANEQASPMVSSNLQNPKDDGTLVDVSFTTAGSFNVELPSGVYFTAIISASGSPLPSVVMTARGEIEAA